MVTSSRLKLFVLVVEAGQPFEQLLVQYKDRIVASVNSAENAAAPQLSPQIMESITFPKLQNGICLNPENLELAANSSESLFD